MKVLKINNKYNDSYVWYVPVILMALLVVVSQFNFLLFHTLAEMFAIIVAILMFVIAWQTYPFTRNSFLMYLGTGYAWVAMLDIFHTLSYKGMGVYGHADANMAIQFWIGTRYLEALLLVTAPWFLTHQLHHRLLFSIYALMAGIIFITVSSGYFPVMFVEGAGLTESKVISEYIIIAILSFSLALLWKRRAFIDTEILRLMMVSIILTMCAELAFTFYVNLYGISNISGHVLKFISFWLVFVAVIKTTLTEPFHAMTRASSTYDAIPDAVLVVDSDGVIRETNSAACHLAGANKEALIGESSHEIFHSKLVTKNECQICIKNTEGKHVNSIEFKDEKKDRWLDFTLSPLSAESEYKGMVEVIRDVTHRKLAEQKYETVNELKNSIIENLPAMLFVKKAEDNRYVEWNKSAEEITGLSREEMLGKNDYDHFTQEEAEFYIEMDKKVLDERKLHDIPEETIHTKYKGVRVLHTRKIPIFDSEGNAVYLLGISQDITEKRENEEVLRHSQKMDAVGQLSGGIAHDFNNQLGIVTGYLEFLKDFLKNEEKQTAWVNSANKAAKRCVELTAQLLMFSRTKSPDKSTVDINGVIDNLIDMIEKSVTPEVKVSYQFEEKLWPVKIDDGELGDAVINMVINSRDAMPNGGDIIIRTSNVYLDEEVMIAEQGIKPGDYVMLEVQDNGMGMATNVIEHIFEPFFTTKPVGSGTGLGLAMVYSFAQRYEGTIKVESTMGYGTSIRIYLPRVSSNEGFASSNIDPDNAMVLPGGEERVLIVDDEIELLNLTSDYITSLGYSVFKASNGVEALEVLDNNSIDLVFSDIVMPGGINGYELSQQTKEKYPNVKVLLSSGYIGRSPTVEYKGVVVNKPYTRQEIAFQIRSTLDH